MKITPLKLTLLSRSPERGSAVLVLLAFVTIMMILSLATTRTIYWSRSEVALIEQHQIARLAGTTNQAPTSALTAISQPTK